MAGVRMEKLDKTSEQMDYVREIEHTQPSCLGSMLQANVAWVSSFCDSCTIYIWEEMKFAF